MCKHIVYTTIVNFQMNIVHRRKIKNRKKKKKLESPFHTYISFIKSSHKSHSEDTFGPSQVNSSFSSMVNTALVSAALESSGKVSL